MGELEEMSKEINALENTEIKLENIIRITHYLGSEYIRLKSENKELRKVLKKMDYINKHFRGYKESLIEVCGEFGYESFLKASNKVEQSLKQTESES